MNQTSASHFDYIHMVREQQRQGLLPNPSPFAHNPPQQPVTTVAQQPISVAQADSLYGTPATTAENKSSGWKTAALWVAGVAASTIIAYLVTKALVRTENHIKNNGFLQNPEPESAGMPGPATPVIPSDEPGVASALKKAQADIADIQSWISARGKAA